MPAQLTLYGRAGCHLCEDMERELHRYRGELDFDLRVIDIDDAPELVSRYGTRIPVLVAGDDEICHFFLDETALRRHLASRPRAAPG